MAAAATSEQPGLRERKKQRTRELIGNTARDLFVERGFEQVTVAEIARGAEVAEKTVFNYFPTKEDLVYWRLEAFEGELLDAIRSRAPGESALTAFGRFVILQRGYLNERDPAARERLLAITRMIDRSPSLLAREEQVFERYSRSLARLLAEETGAKDADIWPSVAATAMMGVHRALVAYTRRALLDGASQRTLVRDVRRQSERALAGLADGLGSYAVRQPGGG